MNIIKVERNIIIRIIIFNLEDATYRFVICVYHTRHILIYISFVLLSKIQIENIIFVEALKFFFIS